jgi:hypothetical protein
MLCYDMNHVLCLRVVVVFVCMVVVGVEWTHSSSHGLFIWTFRNSQTPPGPWGRSENQGRGEYSYLWAGSDDC